MLNLSVKSVIDRLQFTDGFLTRATVNQSNPRCVALLTEWSDKETFLLPTIKGRLID